MQNIKINMTSKKAFNHKSRQTVPSQSHCNFNEKKQTFPCCPKLCIKMHTEKVNVRTCRGLAWQKKRLETGWDGDKWSDLRQIEKDKAQKQKSVGAYNSHLFKNILVTFTSNGEVNSTRKIHFHIFMFEWPDGKRKCMEVLQMPIQTPSFYLKNVMYCWLVQVVLTSHHVTLGVD